MEINKDQLFKELVTICKESGAKLVQGYYGDTCYNSLASYNSMVSTQSDYFWPHFIYFIDEDEKIIYLEHGWEEGAHQILLKFNENLYHYDFYELPYDFEEHQYPQESDYNTKTQYEKAESKYWSFWDNWNEQHTININTDIFTVLKEFYYNENDYGDLFSNITKDKFTQESDIDKVIKDFIYRINDSSKMQTDIKDENDFFNNGGSINIIGIDTKIKLITIEKIEKNGNDKYKFIVDITNDNDESFCIKTFIETKEQLNQQIEQTVEALKQYPQFSKYADDLENCL